MICSMIHVETSFTTTFSASVASRYSPCHDLYAHVSCGDTIVWLKLLAFLCSSPFSRSLKPTCKSIEQWHYRSDYEVGFAAVCSESFQSFGV